MAKPRTEPRSKKQLDFRFLGAVLVVLPLAAVIWLIMDQTRESSPEAPQKPERMTNAEAPARLETEPAQKAQPEPAPRPEPKAREDDVTLASAQPENKPGDPSHPMSPDRMRAYHQDYIIGQIDGAILVKDYEGIRRLNAQYRREYPDDDQLTREAYDMIADCFEHKTPELVERARKFWETKRGSRARRALRHACLE